MKWEVKKLLIAGANELKDPSMIVVHAMAEYIDVGRRPQHAWEFLAANGLSAHALITPSGVVIVSRLETEGAYHARNYNNLSFGIEFLVPGVHTYASFLEAIKEPYLSDMQYQQGVTLVREWKERYPIKTVVGHSQLDPIRKRDPGEGFPWDRFGEDIL